MSEPINLGYVKIHYEEPVVYLLFSANAELGFPEIRELTIYAEKLSGNKPYLVLSDVSAGVSVSSEGRKLAADGRNAPLNRASAVIVPNTLMRYAANFFYHFRTPDYPFRAFTNKEEALTWLLLHK